MGLPVDHGWLAHLPCFLPLWSEPPCICTHTMQKKSPTLISCKRMNKVAGPKT